MRRLSWKKHLHALGVLAVWAILSSRLFAQDTNSAPAIAEWRPIFCGIEKTELRGSVPRPMQGYAMRIDLQQSGISFAVTPSNGELEGETDGLKTSTFLVDTGCQVAINAAPFKPVRNEEHLSEDVLGLMISRGEIISPQEPGYPGLLITRDRRIIIADPPFSDSDIESADTAVCGFKIILRAGKNTGDAANIHPRTAAGVSRDGDTLYLLVIDGRQPGYSEGATTAELGAWLAALGAFEGISLDGGGTTTMVLRDANGKPEILNRPIHLNIPGNERPSASHLGIRARPWPCAR